MNLIFFFCLGRSMGGKGDESLSLFLFGEICVGTILASFSLAFMDYLVNIILQFFPFCPYMIIMYLGIFTFLRNLNNQETSDLVSLIFLLDSFCYFSNPCSRIWSLDPLGAYTCRSFFDHLF